MSWEKVKLKEITEYITDGDHQPAPKADDGVRFIKIKDIKNSQICFDNCMFVPADYYESLPCNRKPQKGDTLYTVVGSYGLTAFVDDPNSFCFERNIALLHPGQNVIPKFLFYLLSDPTFYKQADNIANGSAQKLIPLSKLSNMEVQLPPIGIQLKITDMLSTYDDLIENNQKQIKLLEEAAQRLYKEWFVDLHFPGYENTKIVDGVPEGWEYCPFSDIFDYVRGKSYTSKEIEESDGILMANLKNIAAFGGYNRGAEKRFSGGFKEDQLLQSGDIIMGVTDMTKERRLVGSVAFVPETKEKMIFSMDLIKIIPKMATCQYLYSAMRYGGYSYQVAQLANGTNVLHLKPDAMESLQMILPTMDVMDKFSQVCNDYQKQIEILENTNTLCVEARDRLLPKLMSGELEV